MTSEKARGTAAVPRILSLMTLLEAGGVQNIIQPRGDTGYHSASSRDAVHASILWVGVALSVRPGADNVIMINALQAAHSETQGDEPNMDI